MKNNYNICSKMWTDVNISLDEKLMRHCCKQEPIGVGGDELDVYGKNVFEKHPQHVTDRHSMVIDNQLPENCQWCIDSQPNSIKDVWNEWSDDHIVEIKDQLLDGSFVKYIEIELGKSCDMACVYCGPTSSTTWAKELGYPADNQIDEDWKAQLLENLGLYISQIPSSRRIIFNLLGGEPLIITDTYNVITELAKYSAHFEYRPVMMITTNMNCKSKLFEKFLRLINDTQDIFEWNISISIENVRSRAEAVRYHLDWNRFESNVNQIKILVHRIYLTTTFNILTLDTFDDFINWAFDTFGENEYTNHWDFSLNSVQYGYTDLAYCPKDLVDMHRVRNTYMDRIAHLNNLNTDKVEQFLGHLDNMYARLGTKTADQKFHNYWHAISHRRNLKYTEMEPIKSILGRLHDQIS